ncbi:hypothetical protein [Dickeya poaceiphila]|uniref:hypothetical protein n=1 Tax=Dickeya poaceiphila TaxID=568768 RepID=UPI001563D16D|nr:hypothetical protein [Dickeya poaceiphila]
MVTVVTVAMAVVTEMAETGGMLELAAMVTAAMGGMGAKTAEMEGMGGMATGQEMAETAAMQDQVA